MGETLPSGFDTSAPNAANRDCDDTDARRGEGNPEICNGVDDNCDGTIDEDDTCADSGCIRAENPDTGAIYLHCTQPRGFDAWREVCVDQGYAPVSLETHSEMVFVSELASTSPPHDGYVINGSDRAVWVGANDFENEGTFVWESGFPFSMAAFVGATNPDNLGDEDCVEWHADNRGFNDALCANERPMVCEPKSEKVLNSILWPPYSPPISETCVDEDRDGFGLGCPRGPDCDDDDDNLFRLYLGYLDVDGDDIFGIERGNICGGSQAPGNLVTVAPAAVDCDDTDPDIGNTRVLYLDGDGDGVPSPTPTNYDCSVGLPPANALVEVEDFDCQDALPNIHPGAPEFCDAIDNNCDGAVDEDACYCETQQFEGKGYLFCQDRVGVDNNVPENAGISHAIEMCRTQGDRVPAIANALSENTFIAGAIANGIANSWVGLLYDDATGEWRDPFDTIVDDEINPPDPWPNQPFTRWAGGQPDPTPTEKCVRMASNGRWHDTPCNSIDRSTVCE